MKFKFIGRYTGERDSITMYGPEVKGVRHSVTFNDREPSEVEDKDMVRRLSNNPEFEKVDGRTKAAKKAEEAEAE